MASNQGRNLNLMHVVNRLETSLDDYLRPRPLESCGVCDIQCENHTNRLPATRNNRLAPNTREDLSIRHNPSINWQGNSKETNANAEFDAEFDAAASYH